MIHPKSYVHAISVFNDGMIKILSHATTMEIPIANTLNNVFKNSNFDYKGVSMLNLKNLNNLELSKIKENKFPLIKILKTLLKKLFI